MAETAAAELGSPPKLVARLQDLAKLPKAAAEVKAQTTELQHRTLFIHQLLTAVADHHVLVDTLDNKEQVRVLELHDMVDSAADKNNQVMMVRTTQAVVAAAPDKVVRVILAVAATASQAVVEFNMIWHLMAQIITGAAAVAAKHIIQVKAVLAVLAAAVLGQAVRAATQAAQD